MRSRERRIAKLVAEYLEGIGNSQPLLEFSFKKCRFDVLGYDKEQRVLYLVECKSGKGSRRFGSTFGQILPYIWVISNDGRSFLREALDRSHWFGLDEISDMLKKRVVPIRFFVAFEKKYIQEHEDLLEWVHGDFLTKRVGILLVDEKKCQEHMPAEIVNIPLRRILTPKEFVEQLRREASEDEALRDAKCRVLERGIAIWYFIRQDLHFEVGVRRRKPAIWVGLHLEDGRRRNLRIFRKLKKREKEIRRAIPEIVIERWGKNWSRAYETIDWTGDTTALGELLEVVHEKLVKHVSTLKPILDSIEWGRLRA